MLLVRKPDGGVRLVVDYRALNAVIKRDAYPLPLLKETLRTIATADFVSKVDVVHAFHRIRIREGDEPLTAFRTFLGAYEWLVTPFGLATAQASFQRYINSAV